MKPICCISDQTVIVCHFLIRYVPYTPSTSATEHRKHWQVNYMEMQYPIHVMVTWASI